MRAGDPPRTRIVLRLIAVERSLRGLLLLAAGTYLLFHLSTDFGQLAERIIRSIDIDPRQHFFLRVVTRLIGFVRVSCALSVSPRSATADWNWWKVSGSGSISFGRN